MKSKSTKDKIIWFIILNAGLLFTAAGVSLFKTPNHFALGGTSGLSIILSALFPGLDVGTAMLIINLVLLVFGFIFLGKSFGGATIYASIALSLFVSMFEHLIPLTSPITDDTLLELIWAVLLPAIGSALVFNIGASTGGTDIIAMILAKHTSLEIGKALLVSDFLIALATFWVFSPQTALYCVLGLLAKTFLVDIVIDGINSRKDVTVISSEHEKIQSFILDKLHRGATISQAEGAFTHEPEVVINTVLTRREAVLLRNYIRSVDKGAFITIVNSSEIIGKGFREI
jgi:uncharacterized membrane-anchored protein YitT (DUF2179 family)